ncbi:Thi12p, partial [Saccharomyces cerevisiae YJM1419]|jgi:hypothetical protein
MS